MSFNKSTVSTLLNGTSFVRHQTVGILHNVNTIVVQFEEQMAKTSDQNKTFARSHVNHNSSVYMIICLLNSNVLADKQTSKRGILGWTFQEVDIVIQKIIAKLKLINFDSYECSFNRGSEIALCSRFCYKFHTKHLQDIKMNNARSKQQFYKTKVGKGKYHTQNGLCLKLVLGFFNIDIPKQSVGLALRSFYLSILIEESTHNSIDYRKKDYFIS